MLLVDDSDSHVRALMTLFAEHPELVVVGRARTGADGVALGRRLTPDVVVLDLSLPDISGWKVAAELELCSRRTRVVFLSSHDSPSHRDRARDGGALFVHKSQTERDLVGAVRCQARPTADLATTSSTPDPRSDIDGEPPPWPPAPEFTLVLADHGRIASASETAAGVVSRSSADLHGRSVFELLHDDDVPVLRSALQRVADGESEARVTVRFMHVNGAWRWLETRCYRCALEGPLGRIVLTASDVTDLERAMAELSRSDERFRQVTETIEEVFWLTDVGKQQMIYVSPAYERIWGRSCESLYAAPRSWLDAIHVADRQRVAAAALNLQASGEYDVEYRIIRPDGRVCWIRDKAYPLSDPDGVVYRIAGCAADITHRRELEQRLEDGRMLEAVGRLAASISHDFNNMLAVILGQGSYLVHAAGLEPEAHQSVVEIVEAARRAAALSVQLMAFSLRHAHAADAPARKLDLGDAMTRLVRLFRRVLGPDVVANCRVGSSVPLIHAAPHAIDQVIMNLLVNARDAMPLGGSIELGVEVLDREQLRPPSHATRARQWVVLSVHDNGDGIPPEHLSRVFDPLFTTKGKDGGSGLGLATVDAIARDGGGWVEVESRDGVGTTFRVYWPVLEPGTASDSPDRGS